MKEKLFEKQISQEIIYNGKIIEVVKDTIELANGAKSFREVVYHNGGVCCVVKDRNQIYFVKQFRYPFSEVVIELPAGKIEKGESPDYTIIRELEEEIGIEPISIKKIGYMYSSPGFTNEIIHMYYVDEFRPNKKALDEDEFLVALKIDIDEAYKMIEDGRIVDAKTICSLLRIKERIK